MPTCPVSARTVPKSEVLPGSSASTRPVLPHHWALSPAPEAPALKTIATEKAVRPPTGLLATLMRWAPKNRTALPPAGVTPPLRTGLSVTLALATRLLALFHEPTPSPSLRFRSSARQTSSSAPDAGIAARPTKTKENERKARSRHSESRCDSNEGFTNRDYHPK